MRGRRTGVWPRRLQQKRLVAHGHLGNPGGKSLIYAGGTLLVPVRANLLGVDGRSGKVLWTLANCLGRTATPSRWTSAKRDYVLAGNESQIRCIDPRTGNAVWVIEGAGPNAVNVVADGDLLVARAARYESPREGRKPDVLGLLGCWRISRQGAELLWKHEDPEYAVHSYPIPILARGYAYVVSFRGPALALVR